MTVQIDTVELPDDIQWVDEFDSHGVGQIITPTLTGALFVEEVVQAAGRRITLDGKGYSWVTRSTLLALQALESTPLGNDETLTFTWADGRTFEVVFDRSSGSAVNADEVMRRAAGFQDADHFYSISVKLITA